MDHVKTLFYYLTQFDDQVNRDLVGTFPFAGFIQDILTMISANKEWSFGEGGEVVRFTVNNSSKFHGLQDTKPAITVLVFWAWNDKNFFMPGIN